MNIVVFGANGKVGSIIVAQLLARGHHVTAFIYGKSPYQESDHLHICSGDARNDRDIMGALKGADAVVSALGSWGTKTKDILSTGMQHIIPAMQQQGVKRIVSLTGSAALTAGDNWGTMAKATRALLGLIAPKILKDGERHLQLLADSPLDWTVIRSPVMNEQGTSGFTLNNTPPGPFATINRDAVADAMVARIEQNDYLRQAPHLHRD